MWNVACESNVNVLSMCMCILVQRRHVTPHESSECSLRPITCDYCQEAHAYNQHVEHQQTCPAAPVTCDGLNGCGQTMVAISCC